MVKKEEELLGGFSCVFRIWNGLLLLLEISQASLGSCIMHKRLHGRICDGDVEEEGTL